MHMPDGYINLATSAGAAVVAAGGVGASLRNSTRELAERQVPLAGLTAAYVFAVQMLNFPVAAGTSGHLLGGALAAILLGPTLGALVVTIVVVVQALLFADGGISALGLNVLNMALITAVVGWLVFRSLMRVLPARTSSAIVASMVAAAVSVVASSIAFVLEYSIGGQGGVAVGTVFRAMVGVHVLIGLGEGLITALTVGTVLAVRPDLVKGVADRELVADRTAPSRATTTTFVLAGLVAALLLVFVLAPLASSAPDGLEKVALDTGFSEAGTDHPVGGPLADYGVSGVESERLGTVLAGTIGVIATFAVGLGIATVLRRRREPKRMAG
ncbi:energy-coupling factor ABC transporter permease [soil metagenome]